VAPPMRLAQDARRAQILACARTLFSERHYAAVSVDAVAEAAGVTRPLVHHYFGSKRDLYVAVVREMFRSGLAPVPEGVPLEASIDAWLDMVWRNRETWLAALGAEGLGRDAEVEHILDRVREAAVDSIIEVLGLGPVEDAPPELRAVLRAYGGLAEAATREWLERGRLGREQIHELLTASLLHLVRDVLPRVSGVRAGV
jgi:AcrR family transcriptional regulator